MALTKKLIATLFKEIDTELSKPEIKADLFVIGGTAMVMAYDARPSTRDIDGIWKPTEAIRKIIEKISKKYGIEDDWLNDAAKGLMPNIADENPVTIFDGEYLTVSAPSPQYLLATKILASRQTRDREDIELLIKICKFKNIEQCIEVVDKYYPGRTLQARSRFLAEEIIATINSKQ